MHCREVAVDQDVNLLQLGGVDFIRPLIEKRENERDRRRHHEGDRGDHGENNRRGTVGHCVFRARLSASISCWV